MDLDNQKVLKVGDLVYFPREDPSGLNWVYKITRLSTPAGADGQWAKTKPVGGRMFEKVFLAGWGGQAEKYADIKGQTVPLAHFAPVAPEVIEKIEGVGYKNWLGMIKFPAEQNRLPGRKPGHMPPIEDIIEWFAAEERKKISRCRHYI